MESRGYARSLDTWRAVDVYLPMCDHSSFCILLARTSSVEAVPRVLEYRPCSNAETRYPVRHMSPNHSGYAHGEAGSTRSNLQEQYDYIRGLHEGDDGVSTTGSKSFSKQISFARMSTWLD